MNINYEPEEVLNLCVSKVLDKCSSSDTQCSSISKVKPERSSLSIDKFSKLSNITYNCRFIRKHHMHCGCQTPKLHMYIQEDHKCNYSCHTEGNGTVETVSPDVNMPNMVTNLDTSIKSEIVESEVTEIELSSIIQGESIVLEEDNPLDLKEEEEREPIKEENYPLEEQTPLLIKNEGFEDRGKDKKKSYLINLPKNSVLTVIKPRSVISSDTNDNVKLESIKNISHLTSADIKVKNESNVVPQIKTEHFYQDSSDPADSQHIIDERKISEESKNIEKKFSREFKTFSIKNQGNQNIVYSGKRKSMFQINKNGTIFKFKKLLKFSNLTSLSDSKIHEKETKESKEFSNEDDKFDSKDPISLSSPRVKHMFNALSKVCDNSDSEKSLQSLDIGKCDSPKLEKNLQSLDAKKDSIKIKSEPRDSETDPDSVDLESCNDSVEQRKNSFQRMNSYFLEDYIQKTNKLLSLSPEGLPEIGKLERCSFCMVTFPSSTLLIDHLKNHRKEGLNVCYYCQRTFSDNTTLKRHIRTHTGEKPYECNICHKKFSLPGNFKKHRDIHSDIRSEPCDICGRAFRRKEHLKQHKYLHTGEKPFKCTLCEACFTARYSLQIHMNNHLGRKPFKCNYCGKGFADKSTMTKHIRIHTGERPFRCKICPKSFTESGSLTTHAATHSEERPYHCSHCSLAFKTNKGLSQHLKIHLGTKQYACKYCGMLFIQKHNMITHERIHTGEKPFKCFECNNTFRSRSCLRKHILIHAGDTEKKYNCEYCNKNFFRKAHIQRHIATHLGIKEYECDFCLKKFSIKRSLRTHIQTFHSIGARQFPCLDCGRNFKRSVYLSTHTCLSRAIKLEPST